MTAALVECADGVWVVDLADGTIVDHRPGDHLAARPRPVELVPAFVSASLVDVDARDETVVVAVERRPPLLVSTDGGRSWAERGGGLPLPRAVALGATPGDVLYAARNRLHVSSDGGVFWSVLGAELPEILAIGWVDG